MKSKWKIAGVLLVAGGGVGVWATMFRGGEEVYEFFTEPVTLASIQNTISATGAVEAMVMVDVGAQVTGQVLSLHADFNSIVTEGQILALLDPRNVETQLRNVQASLRAAESRIVTARADRNNSDVNLESARANLETALLDLELAERNFQRQQTLFEGGLIAETAMETATTQLQAAQVRIIQQRSSVQQAQAQIISRDAAIEQAEAALEQARADLEETEVSVGYTVIRSPVSGVVMSREVDVGQTLSASTSAPTLFRIANDLSRMRVQAAIDEADIGLLGQNNEVTFRVDAYPNELFTGRIEQIRLKPTTSQNVVTYSVVITFDNPDLKVKPGMTANISILVDRREDALSVPNTALRYSPPNAAALLQSRNAALAAAAAPQSANGRGFDPEAIAQGRGDGQGRGDFGGRRGGGQAGRGDFGGRGGGRGEGRGDGGQGRGGEAGVPDGRATTIVAASTDSVYAAGQEWGDGLKIQFESAEPDPPQPGRVWVFGADGMPEPRELMVGLTDGSRTEVVTGALEPGEQVLIGDSSSGAGDGNPGGFDDPGRLLQILNGGGGGRGGRGGGRGF